MSYKIDITFYRANTANVLDIISKLTDAVYENLDNILNENKMYIPSMFDKNLPITNDEVWLYRVLTSKFLFWKQYNLLGRIGTDPAPVPNIKGYAVYMQNQCDQDYEYSDWPKLKFFKDIINDVKSASFSSICKEYNIDPTEIDEDYIRKTVVYKRIENALRIAALGYDDYPNYTLIQTNPLDTIKLCHASDKLEQITKRTI